MLTVNAGAAPSRPDIGQKPLSDYCNILNSIRLF